MAALNELIHHPVRLRIMAALVVMAEDTQAEFTTLRDLLGVTDGNLGAHLRRLEEAGYLELSKTFVARKPRTYIAPSRLGREAFANHVAALEAIVRADDVEAGENE